MSACAVNKNRYSGAHIMRFSKQDETNRSDHCTYVQISIWSPQNYGQVA